MKCGVILYVEDDPDDIHLTMLNLEPRLPDCGFVVKRDGLEALEFLEEEAAASKVLPALMLVDIKMPRMNGLELLRRVRADGRLAAIPVVFLTSSGNERDKREALQGGAKFYFEKPLDFAAYDRIADALRSLLMRFP